MKLSPAFQNTTPGTTLTTTSLKQHEQALAMPINEGMVLVYWSVSCSF